MKKYFCLALFFLLSFSSVLGEAGTPPAFADPHDLRYPQLNFQPPGAERVVLKNGMILYVLEDHELPLINVYGVTRTGSYFDPEGKEGLAELTAMVMRTGGTAAYSGSAIDEELEFLAVNLHISAQVEATSLGFSSLKATLDKGLGILAQTLMQPVFAEDKLQLAKSLKIEELKRIADDPQQLAFREFNRIFYRGDPRGRLASVRSVNKVERSDLSQFHQRFFNPDQMMMAVTGNITKEEALALWEKYFGAWQKQGSKAEIPPPAAKFTGVISHIPKDIPQSVVITGRYAPARGIADFYSFTVLDFVLGSGGFTSHIFQEIRTNQGLAYSAGSFYRAKSDYGVFGTYGLTKSASTGQVLSLLRSIVERASRQSVSAKELIWARNSINNSFLFSFSSTEQIARQQLMLEFENLPSDYLTKYRERIQSVDIDDLNKVAKKYLSDDNTVTLVLGQEDVFDSLPSPPAKIEKLPVNHD